MELVVRSGWHDTGNRKLEAVKACTSRDEERLFDLTITYLEYRGRKRAAVSPETKRTYGKGLRAWLEYCWPDPSQSPSVPLLRVTIDDVDYFIIHLQRKGLAATTVQNYLQGVRCFYKALVWADAISSNPTEDASAPSDPRPKEERRAMLDIDLYKRICDSLSGDEDMTRRDLLMFRLFGDAGLRVGDAVNLNLNDLRLSQRELFIVKGKGGKSATLPMSPQLVLAAERWLEVRGNHAHADETALLVNFGGKTNHALLGKRLSVKTLERSFEKFIRAAGAGPEVYGPHSARHTAGTRYHRMFKDIYKVAALMRHSNIETSAIYAKLDRAALKDEMMNLENF